MKAFDIVKLYSTEYPNFEFDIKSAKRLEAEDKIVKSAEKYRAIARTLLKIKLYTISIDYYLTASALFLKAGNYLKAVSTELTIYEIHRQTYNLNEMASSYEKIASFFTYYLKDDLTAGWYDFR